MAEGQRFAPPKAPLTGRHGPHTSRAGGPGRKHAHRSLKPPTPLNAGASGATSSSGRFQESPSGWTWRGIVPWHKPISRPYKGGFNRACEYILWGTKGPVDAARNPVCLPGLYSASQPRGSKRHHITQKPDELMAELVKICAPEGTVLDPFTGSGSTGVAALTSGRNFIGIEQSAPIADTAHQRLSIAA
ncbi:DNA-methyltransferase [Streptomyces chartreusis]|uniref:DNA-methyltransferase n=1 Tax=Streptomyces chartreusis TaxID=1969 RepID=UPI0038078FD5